VPFVYHDSRAVRRRRYLWRGRAGNSGEQMADSAALVSQLVRFDSRRVSSDGIRSDYRTHGTRALGKTISHQNDVKTNHAVRTPGSQRGKTPKTPDSERRRGHKEESRWVSVLGGPGPSKANGTRASWTTGEPERACRSGSDRRHHAGIHVARGVHVAGRTRRIHHAAALNR
jgi:hypothetical protein